MHHPIFSLISLAVAILFFVPTTNAHEASFPLGGKRILIRAGKKPERHKFVYVSAQTLNFSPTDPISNGASLLVRGLGEAPGKTQLIELDTQHWSGLGDPAGSNGYRYLDLTRSNNGIKKVVWKPGVLRVIAKGEHWTLKPQGDLASVWMHFRIGREGEAEEEWYCTAFGGEIEVNKRGRFKAFNSPALTTCPEDVCGDGDVDLGEECDDGNLDDQDGCNADCTLGDCVGEAYDSTLDAIQAVIFDSPIYQCSNDLCHGTAKSGSLDLTSGNAYANLHEVAAVGSGSMLDRVTPGDKDLSFLYEKLSAATLETPLNGGSPMPSGAQPLSLEHLEAIRLWIQGGAPETGSVAGTETLLEGCLPDATPLTIPPPAPPAPGTGIQVWSNPWALPSQFENEVCFATYYDFVGTGLIPESAQFDCPGYCANGILEGCLTDADCDEGVDCIEGSINNPSGKCFRYHKQVLHQDPQSHHAFVRSYLGASDTTDPNWGPWTYKFADQSNPLEGTSCDPLTVDSSLGFNMGCSSETQEGVACLGSGPVDLSNGISEGLTGSGTTPTFAGSGVPVFEQEFADGVYSVLPMQGILVWNSHAFNLTNFDSTMSMYLNIFAAEPQDQLYQTIPVYDDSGLFTQDVPPFQTVEYCRTWTAPQGARVFLLTSHTHQWGVRWRTWAPPNTPCSGNCGTPRSDPPLYLSTDYSDPLNQYFDPPLEYDSTDPAERTFLYCSLYDNGSTLDSPPVRRQSTAIEPPLLGGNPFPVGGPCEDTVVSCINEPNQGLLCNGDDSICDSFPGAGDGDCDACPVRGGATTTDEMLILQGAYFVVPVP